MTKTRIYLLDDHKIVRDGLKSLLTMEPSFEVVGEGSSPEAFLQELPGLTFDLLILDISLPHISGMDVLKKVKEQRPELLVVMLSMHDNPEYVHRCLRDGANAYLPKDIEGSEFLQALKVVKEKGTYYPAHFNFNLTSDLTPAEGEKSPALLTPKEKEVLSQMARGLSSKQIAAGFGLSARTIETHRLNIMKKLGTNNSAETIAIAAKLNLIT